MCDHRVSFQEGLRCRLFETRFQSSGWDLSGEPLNLAQPRRCTLTTGRSHSIVFEEGGGTQNYQFGEPARSVSSRLDVDIDVKYDGSSVTRTVEFVIEGSMASWLRWGMDNIGNATLPSDHLFKQVQGSVAQDLRKMARSMGQKKMH